tara:strand:- start:224 stop:445 length:222 start_codon:yes stop_codon:yes gene_type:complete
MESSYKPEWLEEDRRRMKDMDRWYLLDGRDSKAHKFNGVYTGLFKIRKRLELEDRMAKAYEANLKKSRHGRTG